MRLRLRCNISLIMRLSKSEKLKLECLNHEIVSCNMNLDKLIIGLWRSAKYFLAIVLFLRYVC